MMVSFPAGIVQVVANNPNPAQLSFKIRNASVFESIVPNLKLVTPSELLSTPDGKVFEFKMDALKELLKVQSEMNPNAAYFNIDLLKYQVRNFPFYFSFSFVFDFVEVFFMERGKFEGCQVSIIQKCMRKKYRNHSLE